MGLDIQLKTMAEVAIYEIEVIKIIRGESQLDGELLSKLHEGSQRKSRPSGTGGFGTTRESVW